MRRPRTNLLRIEEELSEVHLRLASVTIENLPWNEFIKRYDRLGTLFYIDPPYYKAPYYEYNLELKDYKKMAILIASIKSKFVLSINDHPEMNITFRKFKIKKVRLKYSVAKVKQVKAKELLIYNF